LQELVSFLFLEVHNGIEDLVDGVEDEEVKGTHLVGAGLLLAPLRCFVVEEPHRKFISFSELISNLVAYISANCFRVKAQPWRPEPKPQLPFKGS
ncbi:hypothetical protein RvY_16023, partial [Ramazzottius varieornatus]